tara:strand:+ start:1248 stop:2351 length:1104 start_codon:yes stop_codon:yes gene_type:complete
MSKKICFVIDTFDFFLTHRLDLCNELSKKYNVSVITDISGDDISNQLLAPKINFVHVSKRNGIFSYIRYFLALKKIVYKLNPNVAFFISVEISFTGSLLKIFSRNYFSAFLCFTGMGHNNVDTIRSKIFFHLKEVIFKLVTKIKNVFFIFQNSSDKELSEIKFLIPKNKSFLIRGNGIKDFKNRLDFFEKINFCYSGRIEKEKNIEELIHAFKKIQEENNFCSELHLYGDYTKNINTPIDKNLFTEFKIYNIFMHGKLDQMQLFKEMSSQSVFVMPSNSEGLSKATLEAGALGLSIIAKDAPGVRDAVFHGKNGYIYKNSLSTIMEGMIKDKHKTFELRKYSPLHIRKHFSLDVIAAQYIAIIEKAS